jgi:hypothetical protein
VLGDAVHGHGLAQGAGVGAAAAEPATASEANTAAAQPKGRCLNIKWTPQSKKEAVPRPAFARPTAESARNLYETEARAYTDRISEATRASSSSAALVALPAGAVYTISAWPVRGVISKDSYSSSNRPTFGWSSIFTP